MKKSLLMFLFLLTYNAFAQTPSSEIMGTVIDAQTKEPLIGVNV